MNRFRWVSVIPIAVVQILLVTVTPDGILDRALFVVGGVGTICFVIGLTYSRQSLVEPRPFADDSATGDRGAASNETRFS